MDVMIERLQVTREYLEAKLDDYFIEAEGYAKDNDYQSFDITMDVISKLNERLATIIKCMETLKGAKEHANGLED